MYQGETGYSTKLDRDKAVTPAASDAAEHRCRQSLVDRAGHRVCPGPVPERKQLGAAGLRVLPLRLLDELEGDQVMANTILLPWLARSSRRTRLPHTKQCPHSRHRRHKTDLWRERL
ncbi:hypothetical protein ACWEK5_20395 [Rhodococcus koreensis]